MAEWGRKKGDKISFCSDRSPLPVIASVVAGSAVSMTCNRISVRGKVVKVKTDSRVLWPDIDIHQNVIEMTFGFCVFCSVQNLKEQIQQLHRIPANSQVLLVSGGEMLLPQNRVCSYSAGTDTNPIFMFSSVDSSSQPQPWPSIEQPGEY